MVGNSEEAEEASFCDKLPDLWWDEYKFCKLKERLRRTTGPIDLSLGCMQQLEASSDVLLKKWPEVDSNAKTAESPFLHPPPHAIFGLEMCSSD
jgi:hypothetical protein